MLTKTISKKRLHILKDGVSGCASVDIEKVIVKILIKAW